MKTVLSVLNIAQETEVVTETTTNLNWWMIVSIIQFAAIGYLFYKNRKIKRSHLNPERLDDLKAAKTAEIDMSKLMDNINNSRDEYKILSRKCHPDRFQDEEVKRRADELFQEISRHKRDHAKLSELKIRAERELNITF